MNGLLILLLTLAPSAQEKPPAVTIQVSPDGWGKGSKANVHAVLASAASTLTRHFPGRKLKPIEVARHDKSPIVLFKRGPNGEYRVRLSAKNTAWAQYAYQFAHEVGHVLCNYAKYKDANKWFEETIAELASLYALRRMAEEWKKKPPYRNWKSYAPSLRKYADNRMKKFTLPEGTTLAAWFRENEPALRKSATRRDDNTKVAGALLPLFEMSPGQWPAVGWINSVRDKPNRSFKTFLIDWRRACPEQYRSFVEQIADAFGITLPK